MMHAAFMGLGAVGGLASSIGREDSGYQSDSDSRAVKHAVDHALSLAPTR